MDRELIVKALREAYDVGIEHGRDIATSFEWGEYPRNSKDEVFNQLFETWNSEGENIRKLLDIAKDLSELRDSAKC